MMNATLSGCTLVGAGVGAGIDSLIPGPYEERPPTELVRLERDQRVIIMLRRGTRVNGRYRGTHGPTAADLECYLLVSADEGLVSVKSSDVSSVAVEVTGKGWLYGGLIGLAIDTVIVAAVIVALHDMDLSSDPNGLHF
ncbi:MAG: hypothetical protein WDO69_09160 [Pseudomonadota bacterium]